MPLEDVFFGAFADELDKMAETETSTIGGERITEKKGKLTQDLGKPPSQASEAELEHYIEAGGSPAERQKRMARVNLFRAHMKGVKAQTGIKPHAPKVEPGEGSIKKE